MTRRFRAVPCLAVLLAAACGDSRPVLHVFNWADYFAPDTLETFERETGARVVLDTYGSGQDLVTRLQAGGGAYDVCFPSDEVLPALIGKGLLRRIDHARIPNKRNLRKDRLGLPADPENAFSIPYFSGTTGIAWNRDKLSRAPASWNDLWDPAHAGRVSILDDAREALGAALRADGAGVNETDPGKLRRARDRLLALKPNLHSCDSSPREKLVAGDLWIAQCFSGDAVQAMEGAPIDYVVPREGGTLWVDSMAIPASARNVALAHRFIDYILRADVAAKLAEAVGYGSPNEAAVPLMSERVRGNPIVLPPADVLSRCELLGRLGDAEKKLIDDLWTEVKLR